MLVIRTLVLLLLTCSTALSFAQTAPALYVGFPAAGEVDAAARAIATELGKRLKLPYRVANHAGNFTKVAVEKFQQDPATDSKLLLASPSPGYPSLASFRLVALVGEMWGLPEPFGLYAAEQMPEEKAQAIGKAVQPLFANRVTPPSGTGTQAVTATSPLREIRIPGKTVQVPGGGFAESASVQTLCQPTSVRAQIRDKAGRNYLREQDLRQVLEHGQRIAQASDQWARALGTNTLIQRQLPNRGTNDQNLGIRLSREQIENTNWGTMKPPAPTPVTPVMPEQQKDLDYNFAVLEAVQADIETAAQAYLADLTTVELNAALEISRADIPVAEIADLTQQLDRFVIDNFVCRNDRLLGRKAMDDLRTKGWPVVNIKQALSPAWHAQNLRAREAGDRLETAFLALAERAIRERRSPLVGQLNNARTPEELPRLMAAAFGTGRLGVLAMKDPELSAAFSARSATLLAEIARQARLAEERRIAADKARALKNFKSNGKPSQADVQALIAKVSMQASTEALRQRAELRSETGYNLYGGFFDVEWKTTEVDIVVSNLTCQAKEGGQHCSWDEHFVRRDYATLLSEEPIRSESSTSRCDGRFRWTATQLTIDGELAPLVTYVTRGRGSAGGGGSPSGRGSRDTMLDQWIERDRDNRARYDDAVQAAQYRRMEQYNPQKQY